jgi:hypothetical protein
MFFFCAALSGQVVKHKTVTIHPNKSFQNYEHFKRLTLSSPDSYVEYISGFEFEWGYTYQLLLKETELLPLSDGTRLKHELVKVISKTKVPDSTQFRMFLDVNLYYYAVDSSEIEASKTLIQKNDSTYLYFEEVEIIVPPRLTAQFKSIVDGATKKVGTFEFIDEKKIRLVQL